MALATSKRKFYKLLDNLSSPKVNDTTSNPAANDRPVKRNRMLDSTRRPNVGARHSTTSVRLISSSFERAARNSPNASPSAQRGATSYAPWSHEQFLERLRTFADVKLWTPKPEPISEIHWAKRGWIVFQQDTVICNNCGRQLNVILPPTDPEDKSTHPTDEADAEWFLHGSDDILTDKYKPLIKDAHTSECPWRKGGCKDDIYRIKFSDPSAWKADLATRYSALDQISNALPKNILLPKLDAESDRPSFNVSAIADFYGPELVKHTTTTPTKDTISSTENTAPEDALKAPAPSLQQANQKALLLALCGWTGQNLGGVQIATCQKCFMRVGLWLHSTMDMEFDPVALHRPHCPWQNPTTQCGVGSYSGIAAWEILAETVQMESLRAQRHKRQTLTRPVETPRPEEPQTPTNEAPHVEEESIISKEDLDAQDKIRESKLARLKRAFSVKNTIKKTKRPLSARSSMSFTGSIFSLSGKDVKSDKDLPGKV